MGRLDPRRQGRHWGPVVAVVPVRRPRRPRDARCLPGCGRHYPGGTPGVDRTSDQPGGAAAAGVAGVAARVVCDIELAAGTPDPIDVRAVHTASGAGVRVVGGCAQLAADAGRAGVGVRRCHPAGADRQPPLRRHRCPGLPRWPAVLREGRGDPVRLLRGGRAAVPCARRPVSFGDGVAGRCPVVDAVAGTDRRLGSPLSGGGGSTAMEFRSVDDVGSAVPFGHPRHSAGTGRRAVGLGALGSGIPVGHSRRW